MDIIKQRNGHKKPHTHAQNQLQTRTHRQTFNELKHFNHQRIEEKRIENPNNIKVNSVCVC